MARQIAPGTPGEINALNIKPQPIDLEVFDKLGDAKIKTATAGFKLYAETTAKAEAQKLYAQFKNDPIGLSNALSKLPDMFKELPESIQTEVNAKLYLDSVSLVSKAQANQEKLQLAEYKRNAFEDANLSMTQLADDTFNVLRFMTAPAEEKRSIDYDIYKSHRQNLNQLAQLTDEEGKPLFSESQRTKMMMPKESAVDGFKQFIYRMEEDQLKDWDKNIFQNRDQFKQMLGIDDDAYDTMETALKNRMTALADKTKRKIHGQAWHDAAALITDPTELAIEKAKSYDFANKKAIDSIVKASKKTTLEKYYDPTRKTSPGAFMQAYAAFGEAIEDSDWSYEGRQETLTKAGDALAYLGGLAKEANLPPEQVDIIKQTVFKAITDKASQEVLIQSGAQELAQKAIISDLESIGAAGGPVASREDAAKFTNKLTQESAQDAADKLAKTNLQTNLINAFLIFNTGDQDQFQQAIAAADKQYKKDKASFMVRSNREWERLEKALAEKQPATIQYMGTKFQFNGFDNEGALFNAIF